MESSKVIETFWPLLKKTLREDPSRMKDLSLKCVSCSGIMTVVDDDRDPRYRAHAACILPCGHMIGYSCWNKRHENCKHHCPSCRGWMIHPRCGHPHLGIHMPTNVQSFSLVPLTVAEKGAGLAPNCGECSAMHLVDGLENIFLALDQNDEPPKPNHFFGFAILNGSEVITPEVLTPEDRGESSRVRREEIPDGMVAFVAEAAARFNAEGGRAWRTWKLGNVDLQFGLYKCEERAQPSSNMIGRIFRRKQRKSRPPCAHD